MACAEHIAPVTRRRCQASTPADRHDERVTRPCSQHNVKAKPTTTPATTVDNIKKASRCMVHTL